MAASQSFFQRAQNFQVHNGQFINIAHANGTVINNTTNHDAVSIILLPWIAAGAIFDSAERYPAGKCHPGTRQRIINWIINWIDVSNPTEHILWLFGPAGTGKSALAHSICELLHSHPERSGSTFFFAKGSGDRGNGLKLFSTISYQLALQFPSMRAEINSALYQDPSLPSKSMETQLHSLIIQPLLRCRTLLSHPPVIIIDGLDECANIDTQEDIITLIAKFIAKYNPPLRFIIASRPEYWIRDAFNNPPLAKITAPLSLRDDFDADEDIRTYLTDEFAKIHTKHKRIMGSVVPPWPPTHIVDRFVYEATGQFIYALTILKFVGHFSSDPQEQLRIITGPDRASAFAGSELDSLYRTILSAYPRWETMKKVLAGIFVGANTTIIKVVLGLDPNELVLVLDALGSVIIIQEPEPLRQEDMFIESSFGSLLAGGARLLFCHLSFREFLEDETRSGNFHIDLDEVRDKIVRGFFAMIHRNLDQNYEIEPYIFLNIDLVTYHIIMQDVTLYCVLGCGIGTLLSLITHLTERLVLFNPGGSMIPRVNIIEHMVQVNHILKELNEHSSEYNQSDEFRTACKELAAAVQSTQHIRSFPLRNDFKVTPFVVFLTEYHHPTTIHLSDIWPIPGATDAVSTIKQHRHFFRLDYSRVRLDHLLRYNWFLKRVDLNLVFDKGTDPRIRKEWEDQRILLADYFRNTLYRVRQADSAF